MEHIKLLGADAVYQASVNMQAAADSMLRAAQTISDAMDRHEVVMHKVLAMLQTRNDV